MPEIQVEPERAEALLRELGAQAEAEAFERQASADKQQARMETAAQNPESWRTVADQAVTFVADRVCPAWELSADERSMSSAAIAETLDHYFPGAVSGFDSWHPLSKLAGAACFIVLMRIDLSTGKLPPLQHRKALNGAQRESTGRPADPHDGHDALGENGAEFRTHGD